MLDKLKYKKMNNPKTGMDQSITYNLNIRGKAYFMACFARLVTADDLQILCVGNGLVLLRTIVDNEIFTLHNSCGVYAFYLAGKIVKCQRKVHGRKTQN